MQMIEKCKEHRWTPLTIRRIDLCSLQWFLLQALQFYPLVPLLDGGTTPCKMLEAKVNKNNLKREEYNIFLKS